MKMETKITRSEKQEPHDFGHGKFNNLLKEYIEKILCAKNLASKIRSYIAEEIIKQIPPLIYERYNLNTDTIVSNEYKLYLDFNIEKYKTNINILTNFLHDKDKFLITDQYNNKYRYSIDNIVYVNKTDRGHIIGTYKADYYTDYMSSKKIKNYNYYNVRYIIQTLKIVINVEAWNDRST